MKTKKSNSQLNRNLAKFALYGLLILIAFSVADLAIIWTRSLFVPKHAPPQKQAQLSRHQFPDRSQYSVITNRNLFSSLNQIPDPLQPEGGQVKQRADVPVPSNLPMNLIGTLVHTNPAKSVAAIEIKSKNLTGSYIVGAEIESLAKLEKVERGIIYFRNLNNGQLEFIEMKQGNAKVAFDGAKPTTGNLTPVGKEIQAVGNNSFRIKRSDLNKYLNDLNSLLLQARAIPNTDSNGEINGYRLVDYQPGSIFDQLGLPRGTLLKRAGDEPITSIQAAMQAFQLFKSAPNIKLLVEIGGQEQTMNYEVGN